LLAAYTIGQALFTLAVFLGWVVFLGVGIWLLVRLFRNKNFIAGNRGLRIAVKVLLVVLTLFVPLLGVVVLFVIWYSTRSRGEQLQNPADAGREVSPATPDEATPNSPTVDRAPSRRPLPFPPPSAPKDEGA